MTGLLEVASSAELETIPIRRHEETLRRRIYVRAPVKPDSFYFEQSNIKTFTLLQAHLTRSTPAADLVEGQAQILGEALSLLFARVDAVSSNAWTMRKPRCCKRTAARCVLHRFIRADLY